MTLKFKMVNGLTEVNTDGVLSKHTEGRVGKKNHMSCLEKQSL